MTPSAARPRERARGTSLKEGGKGAPCSDEEARDQPMEILVQGTSPERTERMV